MSYQKQPLPGTAAYVEDLVGALDPAAQVKVVETPGQVCLTLKNVGSECCCERGER